MFNMTIKLKEYEDPAVFENCTDSMVKAVVKSLDMARVTNIHIEEVT